MTYNIWQLLFFFFLYSVIGWFALTGIRSIQNRRPVNVGILDGPVCPSCGVILTLCIWLVGGTREHYIWQYMLCVFICVSVLSIEKRISTRLVGQSQQGILAQMFRALGRFKMAGCYLVLGLIGFCVCNLLQPFLLILVNLIHPMILFVLDLVLIGIFIIDLITSGLILRRLRSKKSRLQRNVTLSLDEARLNWTKRFVHMLYRRIEYAYPEMEQIVKETNVSGDDRDVSADGIEQEPEVSDQEAKLKTQNRKQTDHTGMLDWEERFNDPDTDSRHYVSRPEFAEEYGQEQIGQPGEDRVFASGLGFMKLFWVFLICALVGDLVEMVYCGVVDGKWMSRSSFLYGPMSIVWGGGAALGIAALEPLAKKNDRWVFFGGFFLGGAYEYLCSVFTELVFGQVFWDYSDFPLNIGGRTNVLFMFFWGIVALILLKFLYPLLSKCIEKIKPLPGLLLTWLLMIVLVLDLLITGLALGRYALRQNEAENHTTDNQVFMYLDTHYPDEMIEKRWQNMKPTS